MIQAYSTRSLMNDVCEKRRNAVEEVHSLLDDIVPELGGGLAGPTTHNDKTFPSRIGTRGWLHFLVKNNPTNKIISTTTTAYPTPTLIYPLASNPSFIPHTPF